MQPSSLFGGQSQPNESEVHKSIYCEGPNYVLRNAKKVPLESLKMSVKIRPEQNNSHETRFSFVSVSSCGSSGIGRTR